MPNTRVPVTVESRPQSGVNPWTRSDDTCASRLRRFAGCWRFAFLRISVRYHAELAATNVGGQSLNEILAKPV